MKLASIPSILFSKTQTTELKLQEQPYIILIPKSILDAIAIDAAPTFDLIYENGKLSLISRSETETTAPPAKETAK